MGWGAHALCGRDVGGALRRARGHLGDSRRRARRGDAPASAPGAPRPAPPADVVTTETQLREAWADPRRTPIDLGADIFLRDCYTGDPIRESPYPMTRRPRPHHPPDLLREAPAAPGRHRLPRPPGRDAHPGRLGRPRGGAHHARRDPPRRTARSSRTSPRSRAAASSRCAGRRSSARRISGNLANDDGGGVYARRGGVQVYDSVLSNNLVDGSGGADRLHRRHPGRPVLVDGNTTDGDGGALYADEDGDVTVIDSIIDGSDADGPGGAIFTLDGDVAVLGSTLIGNRADDRGGAISGEADVLVVNSTSRATSRSPTSAAGSGRAATSCWSTRRSPTTTPRARAAAPRRRPDDADRLDDHGNIASVGANVGSARTLARFGRSSGRRSVDDITGDTRPTRRSCRVYAGRSRGLQLRTDDTASSTTRPTSPATTRGCAQLEADPNGFVLMPRRRQPGARPDPAGRCVAHRCRRRCPAGQLLDRYVDWELVLRPRRHRHRARATARRATSAPSSPPHRRRRAGARAGGTRGRRRGCRPSPIRSTTRAPWTAPSPTTSRRPTYAGCRRRSAPAAAGHRDSRVVLREPRPARPSHRALDHRARRWNQLASCITHVPVDRAGDRRHRWGFLYDERDGTGLDARPALVPHEGRSGADLRLLRLSRRLRCLEPAGGPERDRSRRPDGRDAWTERGDPRSPACCVGSSAGRRARSGSSAVPSGSTTGPRASRGCPSRRPATPGRTWATSGGTDEQPLAGHGAALDLDESEWDDPDYMLLALLGSDDPRGPREC